MMGVIGKGRREASQCACGRSPDVTLQLTYTHIHTRARNCKLTKGEEKQKLQVLSYITPSNKVSTIGKTTDKVGLI